VSRIYSSSYLAYMATMATGSTALALPTNIGTATTGGYGFGNQGAGPLPIIGSYATPKMSAPVKAKLKEKELKKNILGPKQSRWR
jgi:hypothetical protein